MNKYGQDFSTHTAIDSTKAMRESLGRIADTAQNASNARREEARQRVLDARHELEYNNQLAQHNTEYDKEQARLQKAWDHKIDLENEAKAQDMALSSIFNSNLPDTKTVNVAPTNGNAKEIADIAARNASRDTAESILDDKVLGANERFMNLQDKYIKDANKFSAPDLRTALLNPDAATKEPVVDAATAEKAYARAMKDSGMNKLIPQYDLPGYVRETTPELIKPTEATTKEVPLSEKDKTPAYMRKFYAAKIREDKTLTGSQKVNAISKLHTMFPDAPSAKPSDVLALAKFNVKTANDAASLASMKKKYSKLLKGVTTYDAAKTIVAENSKKKDLYKKGGVATAMLETVKSGDKDSEDGMYLTNYFGRKGVSEKFNKQDNDWKDRFIAAFNAQYDQESTWDPTDWTKESAAEDAFGIVYKAMKGTMK